MHCVHVPPVPAKPAGQSSHRFLSPLGWCPSLQVSQADLLLMVRCPLPHSEQLPPVPAKPLGQASHLNWSPILSPTGWCPSLHCLHIPPVPAKPAGQSTHWVLLPSGWCPLLQVSQADLLLMVRCPALHSEHLPPVPAKPLSQETHSSLSSSGSVPLPHVVHWVLPMVSAICLAGHGEHSVPPEVAMDVPSPHNEHVPPVPAEPGEHATQPSMFEFVCSPSSHGLALHSAWLLMV